MTHFPDEIESGERVLSINVSVTRFRAGYSTQ